jgi:hypothetical protein
VERVIQREWSLQLGVVAMLFGLVNEHLQRRAALGRQGMSMA